MPTALERSGSPFSLAVAPNPLAQGAVALAERALGIEELERLYDRFRTLPGDPWDAALKVLQLSVELIGGLEVPSTGPLLVVANHPMGGVDGVALLKLLKPHRPDTRLLAGPVFLRIPEFRPHLIEAGLEVGNLEEAMRHLSAGGCLACFPAGEPSFPTDPAWNPVVGRLAQQARAAALPVCFEGTGSAFQPQQLLHPTLRTALLAKDVLKRQGSRVRVAAGKVIPARRLAALGPEQATSVLRNHVTLLQSRLDEPPARIASGDSQDVAPVAEPQDPAVLAREIASLPHQSFLVRGGGLEVWVARAQQMPHMLLELGRERERAFRAAGEGTGTSCDVDRFDEWYSHLILWDPARRCLAGSYRMGLTDEILAERGKAGLYTETLFHISLGLLKQLDPALEMGRSFLREGYQGTHGPLMLLWKGIGQWLLRNPRYGRLFGAVSISDAYKPISRALMARWASRHLRFRGAFPLQVVPRRPFLAPLKGEAKSLPGLLEDFDALDEAVSLIEGDKGVPVLFKHYARLGGRFAGFNFDPAFGDVLDGLVVVDLAYTDIRLLTAYMGREEALAFQARHLKRAVGRRAETRT
ncbi:MAG TPA: GNAT family N-acyltransferase [Anaeromyxobacter sp.]|nr:GNAT family N-acyltransferase [Anaeromyxobacter sp.]